ncbi:hypothetical protein OG496_31370 [Streptomyces sp. NBC_00988]|uniref:hypothetical protein n=1 Tax=Streptomyces sp. NBC_00988 TaxID=2903704 RepID=UPI00386A403D|nr:hypothetical protein OG496_31370 [Streptomyces sp. NBC_00988]
MAEWLAPVLTASTGALGVFFTWLAGARAPKNAEQVFQRVDATENQRSVRRERREGYFEALRMIELDLRIATYRAQSCTEELEALESSWPSSRRLEMSVEAKMVVQIFGSGEVRLLTTEWEEVAREGDVEKMEAVAERFRSQVRSELLSN